MSTANTGPVKPLAVIVASFCFHRARGGAVEGLVGGGVKLLMLHDTIASSCSSSGSSAAHRQGA